MRVVIQRVSEASVRVNGKVKSRIGKGLLIFLGIEENDNNEDVSWLVQKVVNLRIFSDEEGKMNFSVQDIHGEVMVISQFTLHASIKKGNRPSYIRAARPSIAIPLYELFIKKMEEVQGKSVMSGEFGADMKVSLLNDGPVTIWMDTKNKE
jgi:D-aminoacyl-tRNA deacylase